MSRKGNCRDNAIAERFFKTIKHEWLLRLKYKNYNELYKSIEEYITWYNTKRLHSSLEYLSPLEKEMEIRKIKRLKKISHKIIIYSTTLHKKCWILNLNSGTNKFKKNAASL